MEIEEKGRKISQPRKWVSHQGCVGGGGGG